MRNNKIVQISLIGSIILLTIFFVPYELSYNIDSVAKLLPAKQWLLVRGSNGDIQTSNINHLNGTSISYQLTSFERGESMTLELNPEMTNGQIIEKGDTIGIIHSSAQQESLVELNGELNVLKATLAVSMSGVKKTEMKEASERLEMSRSEYQKQKKIVERLKRLVEKELIAEEDYQTAEDELRVLAKAVNVREAELESSLSGEKVEEINLLNKQITAVANKISFLESQIDSQNHIIAPFNGRIERSFSQDTLLVLSNIELAVALMPVALEESSYINEGENVTFKMSDTSQIFLGIVQMKQPVMHIVGGKQCVMVLATIPNLSTKFISGMLSKAEINCGNVSLQTYLKRNIQN